LKGLPEDLKRKILQKQKTKEDRQKWAIALWPRQKKKKAKPTSNQKSPEDAKKRRLEKLVEQHENSQLNSEYGLEGIIKLRKMLQSPTKQVVTDEGRLALKFAVEETTHILSLEHRLWNLSNDHEARFALEFHLGVYSLYHAQVQPVLL
jgi:hypothetical protein